MANNTVDSRRRDKRPAERLPDVRNAPAQEASTLRNRPANENDPVTSRLMAKLHRRPSYSAFVIASLLSLVWVAAWSMNYTPTFMAQPPAEMIRILAQLLLPIGIVFTVASFLWRAQQLRLVSEVLMQSAIRLIKPQDIATEGLTSIAQAVRAEVDLLVGGVEHAVQRATVLEGIVHKEISAIERAFGGNEERIRSLVTGLENQRSALHQASLVVADESSPLMLRLENNTQNLDGVINNAQSILSRLEQGLKSSTIELTRTIDEVSERASIAGNEIGGQTAQMERMSGVLVGELQDFSRHLQDQIHTLSSAASHLNSETTNFGKNVQGMETNVVQLLKQSVDHLTGVNLELGRTIERVAAVSVDQIKNVSAEMADVVQNSSGNITYHLKATSAEVASLIERSGVDAAQMIEQSRGHVTDGLQNVAKDYLDKVARSNSELTDRMASTSVQFLAGMDQSANQLLTQLTSSGAGLAGKVEETTNRLFGEIAQKTDMITAKLDEATGGVYKRLDDVGTEVVDQLQLTGANINDLLVTTSGTISSHLKETSDIVGRQMQDSGIALAQNIESSGGVITDKLISISGEFVKKINTAREDLYSLLQHSSSEITSRLEDTSSAITDKVVSATTQLTKKIDASSAQLENLLETTETKLGSKLEEISGSMDGTGARLAELLDSASAQMMTDLGRAGESFSQGLGQTTLQISGRFEQESGLLVSRIDKATKEFDTAATASNISLDEAHRKFSRHVETANIYLSDQLSTAATTMDDRLESISMQLTGKLETTGSKISERLEDVSVLVEKSIDKFNSEMERVLINRKAALDGLIDDAAKRAQDIDVVMTSYMSLIEESLASAETRAKDISRIVAEQTSMAIVNLELEVRKLEASSGGQITQASRVLREQHERAMASMNEMLSSTASDFQQTAQDMRMTAQQVVKDIDIARSDLKRAIFDLPEETKTNADAMRRVVADQIAALNSLADVVKRQTGVTDFSGPSFSSQRMAKEPSPGKSEGATLQASPAAASSALKKTIERLETKVPEAVVVSDSKNIQREIENLTQKLNTVARDIIEVLEDGLPADLEKRFNKNEKDVYTQRLFEARGKKLEKSIGTNYEDDRATRTRVDSYVRLFERLLDTVSDAPKGDQLVEACLSSQSGKIYVMLAEVSGRISPS